MCKDSTNTSTTRQAHWEQPQKKGSSAPSECPERCWSLCWRRLMVLGKALSDNASAQTGAAQRYFPIISGLDIAAFHSESACGSREASDSGVGTRTRRGCGKLENGKILIGPRFRRCEMALSNFQHSMTIRLMWGI